MSKKISLIFNEVKTKLTRLGACLFYSYIILVLLGGVGLVFGIFDFICKFFKMDFVLTTSWWEIIALIVISYAIIKIFMRESKSLLETQKTDIQKKNTFTDPKIIPFNRDFID